MDSTQADGPQRVNDRIARKEGAKVPARGGPRQCNRAGAVDGWSQAQKKFGRVAWKDLFAPAIYYAEHGYAVRKLSMNIGLQPAAR